MRNIKLSTPDRDILAGDSVTLENKRKLLRALDETYFRVDIAAGDGVDEVGTITYPKVGDEVVRRFPVAAAGVNQNVQRSVAARDLWVKTVPRLYLWYSSPVGSTNTFSIRFVLRCFGDGSGMTSGVFVTDFAPPGPAIAGKVQRATVKGGAVFPSSPFGVAQFRYGRLGGDANANDLDVLLAQVVMEESA